MNNYLLGQTLGYITATINFILYIPQVIHVFKVKDTHSIDTNFILLQMLSCTSTLSYAIVIKETPLIVSNVKGLKEIIKRDNSGEVFDKTSENLSKAIKNSLKNDNLEAYKANIRKSNTDYTWSRFIQELEKI